MMKDDYPWTYRLGEFTIDDYTVVMGIVDTSPFKNEDIYIRIWNMDGFMVGADHGDFINPDVTNLGPTIHSLYRKKFVQKSLVWVIVSKR